MLSLSSITIDNTVFNISDIDGQKLIYDYLRPHLINATSDTDFLDDPNSNDYFIYKTYKIHKAVVPKTVKCNDLHRAIIRSAMCELYFNPTPHHFVKGIFALDKPCNAEDGIPSYHTFDKFRIGVSKNNSGKDTIRHFGTYKGGNKYKIRTRENVLDENLPVLRVLSFGVTGLTTKFTCPLMGHSLENHTLSSRFISNPKIRQDIDIHHVLVSNGTSVNSTNKNGPSTSFSKIIYSMWTPAFVNELLGCIVLSKSGHGILHKLVRNDDIINWLDRKKHSEVKWIPPHWQSEEKYNELIAWIADYVDSYTVEDALSYAAFIKSNTLASIHT